MFGALGRRMFDGMIKMAGEGTTKTVGFRLVDDEVYDPETRHVTQTVITEPVTGFWGKVTEAETKRDGIRATDIKFTFPADKVTRVINVDDEAEVDDILYKVVSTWTDAAGVQTVVCFREA